MYQNELEMYKSPLPIHEGYIPVDAEMADNTKPYIHCFVL